jgi:hypothetical protein
MSRLVDGVMARLQAFCPEGKRRGLDSAWSGRAAPA